MFPGWSMMAALFFREGSMRVFLTGNRDFEWRDEIADFLTQTRIDFFDPVECPAEFSSAFRQLKILEGCDLLIAYFAGLPQRHLLPMLEISYASKLAKEVMIVDDIPRQRNWISRLLPYSTVVSNLDGVKEHLAQMVFSPPSQPRLFG